MCWLVCVNSHVNRQVRNPPGTRTQARLPSADALVSAVAEKPERKRRKLETRTSQTARKFTGGKPVGRESVGGKAPRKQLAAGRKSTGGKAPRKQLATKRARKSAKPALVSRSVRFVATKVDRAPHPEAPHPVSRP
ncbi:hypothetical protein BDV93DRAFT_562415 [Ceratobasidium sp. AG-I]|nr:hypothetical protein BDV93DRAFT_562415 [Ceratobasidium sp. AG-I]